jgi:hypothetical protein
MIYDWFPLLDGSDFGIARDFKHSTYPLLPSGRREEVNEMRRGGYAIRIFKLDREFFGSFQKKVTS